MERFYDTFDDPNGDAVLTAPGFELRLKAFAIRNFLRFPTSRRRRDGKARSSRRSPRIGTDALANGQPNPLYQAVLVEGNDGGGIDASREGRPASAGPACAPAAAGTKVDVVTSSSSARPPRGWIRHQHAQILNDRPPRAPRDVRCTGGTYPVTVIANHLRSLIGVDDETPTGFRNERCGVEGPGRSSRASSGPAEM
jgi:hypothetical protein